MEKNDLTVIERVVFLRIEKILKWLRKVTRKKKLINYDALIPEFEKSKGIPKFIYQTNRTKSLPKEINDNIEKIKKLNPDWTYVLFDDKEIYDFILENYGEIILSYYLRINEKYGAARADLFRYLLMYKNGGVYLDMKSSISKDLNTVLFPDDNFIISQWEKEKGWGNHCELKHVVGGEYVQWFIISNSSTRFLRSVITEVLKNIDEYCPFEKGVGRLATLRTTGPIAYTLAIDKHMNEYDKDLRFVNYSDIGFNYSIYYSAEEHNKVLKSNYKILLEPVVLSGNSLKDSFVKKYYKFKEETIKFYLKCRS